MVLPVPDSTQVGPVQLKLSPDKLYTVRLKGVHIKILHDVMLAAHFKGEQCFVVAEAIRQLQESPMMDAHGGTVSDNKDGTPKA